MVWKRLYFSPLCREPLDVRRLARTAERARRAEADVVDQDDQDVGRALRRPQRPDRRKLRVRILRALKLAPCARTPLRLLRLFEAMKFRELSDLVLEHAAAYSDQELKEAVARGPREARAVATRKPLSPALANLLTFHDAAEVLVALARNAFAELEFRRWSVSFAGLEASARRETVALRKRCSSAGRSRPRPHFCFCSPGRPRRRDFPRGAAMQLGRPPQAFLPTNSAALDDIELAAVARHPARFVVALAEALGCEPDLAQRIVDDPSGEPLAVALTALGAANDVVVRILTSNDLLAGESYERIRTLARLNNALDRSATTMVVAAMRDGAVTPRRRQPVAEGRAPAEPSRAASARRSAPDRMLPSPRLRGQG